MLDLLKDKPTGEKKRPQVPNGSTAEVIKDSEEMVSRWVSEGLKPKRITSTSKSRIGK